MTVWRRPSGTLAQYTVPTGAVYCCISGHLLAPSGGTWTCRRDRSTAGPKQRGNPGHTARAYTHAYNDRRAADMTDTQVTWLTEEAFERLKVSSIS